MNILMIAPTPFFADRGCHIRILSSYLRLKRKGHSVTLLTYPLGRNITGIKIKRVLKVPGYKKIVPGFSFFKPLLDLFLLIKSIREIQTGHYDKIYAHLHEGALLGIILRKLFKKQLIFDCQGSLVGELTAQGTIKSKGILSKIIFRIEKYITRKPDKIITSTADLKKHILNNFNPQCSIGVIPDLPDKSLFNPQVSPAKLDLPKDKKIVVYLGGLQKYKGIDYLIKAIPNINQNIHFLIMGYPVERCQKLADDLDVSDRITFIERVPYELAPSYLKLGDLAVSPKTLESGEANAKIYNYMAIGLRVICFDLPENRKILGREGIYVKPRDIQDLADKINETLGSKD